MLLAWKNWRAYLVFPRPGTAWSKDPDGWRIEQGPLRSPSTDLQGSTQLVEGRVLGLLNNSHFSPFYPLFFVLSSFVSLSNILIWVLKCFLESSLYFFLPKIYFLPKSLCHSTASLPEKIYLFCVCFFCCLRELVVFSLPDVYQHCLHMVGRAGENTGPG